MTPLDTHAEAQASHRLDGLPVTPDPRQAAVRAEVWQPFRSYASAHLWAANLN
jgi:3-methyladenine DNA glycosylase/8-oxoguanine DNA glycosylase